MVMPIKQKRKPGRPRGSPSINRTGYAKRTIEMKRKYGDDVFRRFGKRRGHVIDDIVEIDI